MSEMIGLEVRDRKTGSTRVELVRLPVDFGKSPTGPNVIKFPSDRETISRQHGHLHRGPEGLVYVDKSSNGSSVAGERVKNAAKPVRVGDVIAIEDFEIRIIPTEDMVLKLTDDALAPIDELVVTPGSVCMLERTGKALSLKAGADVGQDGGTDSQILKLSFDGGRITLEAVGGDATPKILINNRAVELPAKALSGDVVAIEGMRLEVLSRGQEKIVCGNPECRLLNDLPFEENCIWCGFYLAASGSFTRVTPP